MKKYIKSTTWNDLSPSEQTAAEYARQQYEMGYDLDEAVYSGCNQVAWGNAEPEYEDEDFYMDEPDEQKVLQYLLDDLARRGEHIRRTGDFVGSATKTQSTKFITDVKASSRLVRSVRASSDLDSQRQQYVYRCLEDAPEVPDVDADEYPEKWSQYHHDAYEYRMWCFADGVEDGLFEEDDWNEFKRLWDKCIADLAAPWS